MKFAVWCFSKGQALVKCDSPEIVFEALISVLGLDYGLTTYRKEDFEPSNNGFNCGDVNRLYCAPEVLLGSSSNMAAAADVYR